MRFIRMAAPVVLAGVVTFSVATPAVAIEPALTSLGTVSNGAYSVTHACAAVVGAATSLNQVTYVIDATASAHTTKAAVGIGTTVDCKVVNKANPSIVYGGAHGGEPGPDAVAAGTAKVPSNVTAKVIVCATAGFSDGGSASDC
jgi:hypothetical protein